MANRVQLIEEYAQSLMTGEVAHDYKHVDRVRHWALKIARQEGYSQMELVEAAALLHDIGLASGGRKHHAEVGAQLASAFLREHHLFDEAEINAIDYAIRKHNSLDGEGQLLAILQDADTLDLLGAVGLMRGFTSKWDKPDYLPEDIKGETWGMSGEDFTGRFQSGVGMGRFIVDQINFQISCYDNLSTAAGKAFGAPLVAYMREFMQALEAQITTGKFQDE
ncbi:MAG: HD domain-containing protein [Anaerolineaceae bacterium]|nr:HD domain-containing protein [Anaerolineaceae bacterium]